MGAGRVKMGEDCMGGRKCLCEGSERKGAVVQMAARITQTVTCRALIPGLRCRLLCTRREKKQKAENMQWGRPLSQLIQ